MSALESRWNGPHLKKLRSHFPDYDEDLCLDILDGCNGNVEQAIAQLKGISGEQDKSTTDTPQTPQPTKSQTEWPALVDTQIKTNQRPNIPITKSNSDTSVIKNSPGKAQKGGMKSASSSKPNTPMYDHDEHSAYRTIGMESSIAQINLGKTTQVTNNATANFDLSEIKMKTFPPAGNIDYWNMSLKEELEKPDIRNLFLKLAPRQGQTTPKVCIIMRGVPGSGKSHLATLITGVCGGVTASADNYFIDRRGKYVFKPDELSSAHASSQKACRESMSKGATPIVIDNTNTTAWEMLPYAKMAIEFDYELLLLEPCTSWKKNINLLHKKNVHGISKNTIIKMSGRYETVTVDQLLKMANIGNKRPPAHKPTNSKSNPNVNQFKKADQQFAFNQQIPIPIKMHQPDFCSPPSPSTRNNTPKLTYVSNDLSSATTSLAWSNHTSSTINEFKETFQNYKPTDDDSIFSKLIDQDQKRLICQNLNSGPGSPSRVPYVPRTPPGFSPIPVTKEDNLRFELDGKEDETGKLVSECIDRLLEDNSEFYGEKDLEELGACSMEKPSSSTSPDECVEKSKYELANSLQNLFPDLDGDYLDDIFVKCSADIDWCIDVLLDGGYTMSGDHSGPRKTKLNFDDNGKNPQQFNLVENKKQKKARRKQSLEIITNSNSNKLPPLQFPTGSEEDSSSPDCSAPHPVPLLSMKSKDTNSTSPHSSSSSNDHTNGLFMPIPIDGEDWFDLPLTPSFVNGLTQRYSNPFGTMDFSSLLQDNFSLRIPPSMAFQMFELLCQNIIQKSKTEEDVFSDEKCEGNESNENEDQSIIEDLMEMERITSNSKGEINLKRIMELESRLTERETKSMEECRNGIQRTFVTQIHLTELCKAFPSIPRKELELYYAKHGGKDGAIRTLKVLFPDKFVSQASNERDPSREIQTPSPSIEKRGESADNGPKLSSFEWREIADNNWRLTREYQEKMNHAAKMAPGANLYYLELSRISRQNMKQANENAKRAILDECRKKNGDPNVLDLHRLYVSEAVDAVKEQLRSRQEYLKEKGLRKLSFDIILGQGKHSPDGPRVGPAVMKYLQSNRIPFAAKQGNPGVITVNLRHDTFENT